MADDPFHAWLRPITLADYMKFPGVVDVRDCDDDEPGVATLVVRDGCEGIARILMNSGVTVVGLELREEVLPPVVAP